MKKLVNLRYQMGFSLSFLYFLIALYLLFPYLSVSAFAETVQVKYRGPVDLTAFECEWISRSSVIKRLCYDTKEQYVIVKLTNTYYHYCEVPADIISAWRKAESMGRYYNAQIKGKFDCRVLRVPEYND